MAQILVVDDSGTVRNEVKAFLESEGITVETAIDGLEGIEKASSDPQLKLIICDVNMPNLDGLSMVEKLKADGISVPIIMLATESGENLKQRGREAGVKGWIVKPFNGPASINGIKRLIGVS